MFTAVLFTVAYIWKQPKCPSMGEWSICYIYTIEYYATMRKNEIFHFATTWIDHEGVRLSVIS